MNVTQKLSLKDQILILNSKLSKYDVKYILSIIETDLLILFTGRRDLSRNTDCQTNQCCCRAPAVAIGADRCGPER
jgi:hypothetical protein